MLLHRTHVTYTIYTIFKYHSNIFQLRKPPFIIAVCTLLCTSNVKNMVTNTLQTNFHHIFNDSFIHFHIHFSSMKTYGCTVGAIRGFDIPHSFQQSQIVLLALPHQDQARSEM